ncbi:tail fiber domain-containing protein [Escherichia coli]|uniref:tail fiber domain-containing protein n=1 Tax=Escherichia coli TaxID=562 RepID=UPI003FA04986
MSENNYAALMIKSTLSVTDDIDEIFSSGIYPVPPGNPTSPDNNGGALVVHSLNPIQRHFISNDAIFSTSAYDSQLKTWSPWDGPLHRKNPGKDIQDDGNIDNFLKNLKLNTHEYDDGAHRISFPLSSAGARKRSVKERLEDLPHLTDFLVGDYHTDNLSAWENVLNSGHKSFIVPDGVYRFSDGIDIPGDFRFIGNGAPILGFGTDDDKHYLVAGQKQNMPGASFIFSGTGTKAVISDNRSDQFSSVRYCVRLQSPGFGASSAVLRGIAIIQDMICFDDTGAPTKPSSDQHADYECGIYHDDSSRNIQDDVCVFGYFSKAGTVIQSRIGNDDPDYNTITGGSTMGKVGLAILGSNTGAATNGLSGTRVDKCGLYTLDHHSRAAMSDAERLAYYSTANTWRCLYIDGDVDATSAEINGHYFYGCEFRTRANNAIELDHASNVQFFGGVVEQSPYGIANSDVPAFIGSANVKRGVGFYGLRMNYISQIFNDNFAGIIPVKIIVSGDPLNGRMGVVGKDPAGGYTIAILGSDGNIGDASIQFTKNAADGSTGWKVLFDVSTKNLLASKEGVSKSSLTESGSYSIAAPAGSDATLGLISNDNSLSWFVRPQHTGTGQLQFRPGGSGATPAMQIMTNGSITSGSDSIANVGSASQRYNVGFFAGGTQSTSDAELKDPIRDFTQPELNAAMQIAKMFGFWTWLDDDTKRLHAGTTVQAVLAVLKDEGLDWRNYGFIGFDEWRDEYAPETIEINGELINTGKMHLVRAAGCVWQLRDQEFDRFVMRGLSERLSLIEEKIK